MSKRSRERRTRDSSACGSGFAANLPRAMELKDTFGNVTTLRFGAFERNAALDASQFRFVPPPGADVVGEAK